VVPSTLDVGALALPTTYVENVEGVLTLRTIPTAPES